LAWFPLVQERPLNGGTQHRDDHSRHGTTLLILDVSIDMPAVVLSLAAWGGCWPVPCWPVLGDLLVLLPWRDPLVCWAAGWLATTG